MPDPLTINAVGASFGIIEHMAAEGGPLRVSEIALAIGAKPPLFFRHLRTLVALGYVFEDPDSEKYALTSRLFNVGSSVANRGDLLETARGACETLAQEVKLAVSIGRAEESGVRILDLLRHRASIEITTPPGTLSDFATSAHG